MLQSINNNLNKLYKFSGYLAAFFLILVAAFILIGISSRIFGFYIRGLAEYSGYCMAAASFYALAFTFGKSTGMPTVKRGAVTIKTISNTSITSTKGVTLISLI